MAAGVRRIEAVTGPAAVRLLQERGTRLSGLLQALGTTATEALPAVQKLQAEAKRLGREVEQLRIRAAMGGGAGRIRRTAARWEFDGVTVVYPARLQPGEGCAADARRFAARPDCERRRGRCGGERRQGGAGGVGHPGPDGPRARGPCRQGDRAGRGRHRRRPARLRAGGGAGGRIRIAELFPECQAVVRRMLEDAGGGRRRSGTGATGTGSPRSA